MHSGDSKQSQTNVWPGYVAAMSSLLLSLLLVAAVLVIVVGQVGNISDGYLRQINVIGMTSAADVDSAAEEIGITDEDIEEIIRNSAERSEHTPGKGVTNIKDAAAVIQVNDESPVPNGKSLNSLIDLKNHNFDRVAARKIAALISANKRLLEEIDLSRVNIKMIRVDKLDYRKVDLDTSLTPEMLGKIDFSGVDWGRLSQERIDKLAPIVAKEAIYRKLIEEERSIGVEISNQASARPVNAGSEILPKVEPILAVSNSPQKKIRNLRLIFRDETIDLPPSLKASVQEYFSTMAALDAKVEMRLNLEIDDEFLYRAAFARMMSIRRIAQDAGYPLSGLDLQVRKSKSSQQTTRLVAIDLVSSEK